ncbi:MAG: thioredoxin [bacterium]|nr:thioredoxin [bacterium]MDE0289378.1 thioredoxin [bacterium]MDE0439448.1 thioredoxin [bacterium]
MSLPISDGLLVVVKEDCETCHLVIPVLADLIRAAAACAVVSQDRADFPLGFDSIHDRDLDISWSLGTETTPTVYRIEQGMVVDQQAGWLRSGWERVTGVPGLAPGLPDQQPGCGSDTQLPDVRQRLLARRSAHRLSSRRIELGESEDPIEAAFARGWTDGLPVTPPTEARVARMLEGTDRAPDEVVCILPPDLAECTVEKVAVNAVMAGCLPEYLPVVLAAVEAAAGSRFNIHGISATTYFTGPVLVVNGPVANRIGMNAGINVLGQGNRANSTIGRALNLVVRNVGGARPGGVDQATLGSPGKLSFCFPEDEEGSPWESLAVERGFTPEDSTVTLFAGHGPIEIIDQKARDPESLAGTYALQLRMLGHPKLARMAAAIVVVSPEHARIFREAGWSKARLREQVSSLLTIPADSMVAGAGGIAEGIPPSVAAKTRTVSKFAPDSLWFVHAGGEAGMFSAIISGWIGGAASSQMITARVRC